MIGTDAASHRLIQPTDLAHRVSLVSQLPLNAKSHLLGQLSGGQSSDTWRGQSAPGDTWRGRFFGRDAPSRERYIEELDERLTASVEALWRQDARADVALQSALRASLATIVRRASLGQTLKGVLSAGGVRSFRYVAAKLAKR